MSDGAFLATAIAFFAILGTCSTVSDIETKVDAQQVQMTKLLNECRAAHAPEPELEVSQVEVTEPPPEDSTGTDGGTDG